MIRTILGLHAGAGEHGVHSVLIDIPDQIGLIRPVFRMGMFQPFPPEVCHWLTKAGDKPSRESRYFDNACKIIADQFSMLAMSTIKEAKLNEESIFAVGCDSSLGAMEGSRRYLAFRGWGPGQDISQTTGLSVVCINSDGDAGRSSSLDPVFAYPGESMFAQGKEPVIMLHLGGIIKISAFAPRLPSLTFQAGPCASLFELIFNSESTALLGVDFLSKRAVQGKMQQPLLDKWFNMALRSMPYGKSKNRGDCTLFLEEIQAGQKDFDVEDQLCSAHHFVVDLIKTQMEKIPSDYRSGRYLLTGSHARNGFLRHLLGLSLSGKKLELIDSSGIPAPSWDSFSRAVVAGYALDGVSPPTGTPRTITRPLASFYPGSNASWGKCLRWMERHSRQAG
ncbi:MAG: hypothetical protein EBT92_06330 [Planctomycetes bacterium]|nr:hypothetical protein [Planctomycetota bacterium]NBY03218.1 hypothetical protein [Planctomycetota bacterium]